MLSVSVRVGPCVDAAPCEGTGRSAVARPPSDISPLRYRHPNLTATPSNCSSFRTLSIATGVGGYTVRNVLARTRTPDQRRSSAAHVNHEDQLDAAPTNCATQQHPPQWTRL